MYRFATIYIDPIVDLKTTADIIGNILGPITFLFDDEWDYDEFPAYIAKDDTYKYALLGIPDPEYDIRDDPPNIFQLEVRSLKIETDDENGNGHEDISEEIAARLNRDGRLTCST